MCWCQKLGSFEVAGSQVKIPASSAKEYGMGIGFKSFIQIQTQHKLIRPCPINDRWETWIPIYSDSWWWYEREGEETHVLSAGRHTRVRSHACLLFLLSLNNGFIYDLFCLLRVCRQRSQWIEKLQINKADYLPSNNDESITIPSRASSDLTRTSSAESVQQPDEENSENVPPSNVLFLIVWSCFSIWTCPWLCVWNLDCRKKMCAQITGSESAFCFQCKNTFGIKMNYRVFSLLVLYGYPSLFSGLIYG